MKSRVNPVPIDIPAALIELGIEHTITNNEAKGLCPSPDHDDTTPSWSVNLDSGEHHCFSCGFGGSFVYLVSVVQHTQRDKAETWTRTRKVHDVAAGKQRKADRQAYAEITEADLWAFNYDYPEEELEYRGFAYDHARWYKLMWDSERDGWIIPFYDADDRFIGYQFKPRHGTEGSVINYPTHLKKSGRLFEGVNYIEGDTVILVESPLDVVRLYAMRVENAVSLFGANLDAEQAELIMEKFNHVILMFDDDEAGRHGVSRALGRLKGLKVNVFAYGPVMKAGSYWVHGPVTDKDPGDLTRAEILEGISRATLGFRTGFQ